MVRATLWGREVEMQGSPWTLLVYRREFGGDLLADLVQAYAKEPLDTADFLRFAWSMAATASDEVPGFEEWCRSFPDFTLSDGEVAAALSVISSAMEAELFRSRPSRFKRWRRVLRARRVGRVPERRRA